ncbi:MAG: AgmX/PglI C-terminal domain-containing protein [Polyangiaceae bacterium]
MNRSRRLAVLVPFVLLPACGGETPPATGPSAVAAKSDAPKPAPKKSNGMSVTTELGSIDAAATDRTFQKIQSAFLQCQAAGLSRVEYLAGDVSVFVRVGEGGRARFAVLEDSTLGDRATELCIVSVLEKAPWPSPTGGDAEVRKSFGFDPPDGVRKPTNWTVDRIAHALGQQGDVSGKCHVKANAKVKVTAYVEPDGESGKVQTSGIATPSRETFTNGDCIVESIRSLKVPSPGSYAAKVTFSL